jgi:uncharacterized OB-fold protein
MGKSTRVLGHYDKPMWETIERKEWSLQCCSSCGHVRYPPAPVCPECLSLDAIWTKLKGTGEILSWAVFHKKYFDDHPPPYNTVAVRLDEGPIVVSNLVGPEPEGEWIGRRVEVIYEQRDGYVLPVVQLK